MANIFTIFLFILCIYWVFYMACIKENNTSIVGGAEYSNKYDLGKVFWNGKGKSLVIDDESIKYVTPTKTAQLIFNIISNECSVNPENMGTLLNLTGNYGGDSAPFVDSDMWSGEINEYDKSIMKGLKHNMSQYKNYRSWKFNNMCSVKYIEDNPGKHFSCIYVDPPFGPEYYSHKMNGTKYQPTLGPVNMTELVKLSMPLCDKFALKLPVDSFDIDAFKESLAGYNIKIYTHKDLQKMDNRTHKILFVVIWE
jgi:hypothetical protein